jgi:hypothetical protein
VSRPRSSAGQSTIEYIGIVLLAAALLALAAATWVDGSGIAHAVSNQFARALCVVRGGDCYEDRKPCVTASGDDKKEISASWVVLHGRGRREVLVERRSDGTTAITLAEAGGGGLGVDGETHGNLSFGKGRIGVGGEAEASALLEYGTGWTWIVPTGPRASALIRRAKAISPRHLIGRPPGMPPPDTTFHGWGFTAKAGFSASAGLSSLGLGAGGAVGGESSSNVGQRSDLRTGERTYYVRRERSLSAGLVLRKDARSGGEEGTAGGGGERSGGEVRKAGWQTGDDEEYAITVDRNGRPLDLEIIDTGRLGSASDLPGLPPAVAKSLDVPSGGDRLYTTEAHLDLTEPENFELARRFLGQVTSPTPWKAAKSAVPWGTPVDVAAALRKRLDAEGTIQARTYATSGADSEYGAQGTAYGVSVGGSYSHSTRSTKLLAAMSRGLDGSWSGRADCLRAAPELVA